MWGNISFLINSICSVVVFTLALVTASTMSMTVRERFRELAILKAVGFRRHQIVACLLAESFLLASAGAVVGVGGAAWLFGSGAVKGLTGGIFPSFELSVRIASMAVLIAFVLGVFAIILPARAVTRMSVVDGLRAVD
jgi:putative ABC transport system permease protein